MLTLVIINWDLMFKTCEEFLTSRPQDYFSPLLIFFKPFSLMKIHLQDKSGKKLELATVIAPYDATSKEQLSLAKGQMIIIK